MATTISNEQPWSASGSEHPLRNIHTDDPFASSSEDMSHQRFSNLGEDVSSIAPGASKDQQKRALLAYLEETERRIQHASELGQNLVQSHKNLQDRLKELEQQPAEDDIGPELRERLAEIEKEYHEVGRETARAFLPKSRVASSEVPSGSPLPNGRRSVSPSKYESRASNSPSKLTVPNRKQRNQPQNRIHDIEFATEISTSLLAEIRNVQALLREREEKLKEVTQEKARLEYEAEGLHQRLRALDESEQRYKDENWNLETQVHEYIAKEKEAAAREKRLTQTINSLQAEHAAAQKELDEIKLNHAQLSEEHTSLRKQHDTELGGLKRNLAMVENEKVTLQRRTEDLIGQNQELALAVSQQRSRMEAQDQPRGTEYDDYERGHDVLASNESPPISPVKGTPMRASGLETETLKSSLHHAHRMIQNLKGNIHREKTEKLELKRMLQEARDELEIKRNEMGPPGSAAAKRRSHKVESREFKKPLKLGQLGQMRLSRSEVVLVDEESTWEDDHQEDVPPQSDAVTAARVADGAAATGAMGRPPRPTHSRSTTATSDAFMTADEQRTETDDFQTGAEDFTDEADLTETDTGTARGGSGTMRGASCPQQKPSDRSLRTARRNSFQSTASTSDEDEFEDAKTPVQGRNHKMRLHFRRGGSRGPRLGSEEPSLDSSPASFVNSSTNGTPRPAGQTLFSELGDMNPSDDDSFVGTPSQRSLRSLSVTPARSINRASSTVLAPPFTKAIMMVDSGMMTEPWTPEAESTPATSGNAVQTLADGAVAGAAVDEANHSWLDTRASTGTQFTQSTRPMSDASSQWEDTQKGNWLHVDNGSGDGGSRPISTSTYSDFVSDSEHDMGDKLAEFPSPPQSKDIPLPSLETMAPLTLSTILSAQTEPDPQEVEPEVVKTVPAPLVFSSIKAVDTEPAPRSPDAVKTVPAPLVFSSINAVDTEPAPRSPDVVKNVPAPLDFSTVNTVAATEPAPRSPDVVKRVPAPLALSSITTLASAPVEEPMRSPMRSPKRNAMMIPRGSVSEEQKPPPLDLSVVNTVAATEPAPMTPEPKTPEPKKVSIPLAFSDIKTVTTSPTPKSPEVKSPEVKKVAIPLAFSSISSVATEPAHQTAVVVKHVSEPLEFSAINAVGTEPAPRTPDVVKRVPAPLALSSITTLASAPIEEPMRSPKRNAFMIPRGSVSEEQKPQTPKAETTKAETPKKGLFGSVFSGWGTGKVTESPVIAEDETRQTPSQSPESTGSPKPFKEIVNDSSARAAKPTIAMTDVSSQTALTAEQIDNMLKDKSKRQAAIIAEDSQGSNAPSPNNTIVHHRSQESIGSVLRGRGSIAEADPFVDNFRFPRPGSAQSRQGSVVSNHYPPLPTNHQQVIAAAAGRVGSSQSNYPASPGSMGPPQWPASAIRANPSLTPRTPQGSIRSANTTSKVPQTGSAEVHSPERSAHTMRSRPSSISSFVSEVDSRFNMKNGGMPMPQGFQPGTDPRMIQAITQTMIGEYLWKYTRKAGRGEMSDNRHRRYFWVHPYTRTLYWSDRDPTQAGRAELKAKSVAIDAVRVVTDDNPMPPGLHRKSIIILTPSGGRAVKFTCQTGQRHETWFNALSYLLLRTGQEEKIAEDTQDVASALTQQDIDEFNPGQSVASSRYRGAPSLSSYNSRTTRDVSPVRVSMQQPTLRGTPGQDARLQQPQGTLSRLSNYVASLGTRHGRNSVSGEASGHNTGANSIYQASEVHDSAEDLREQIEQQDREADRLENVRACCDGKHDVGRLTHKGGSRHSHAHGHTLAPRGPSRSGRTSAMADVAE